MKYTQEVLDHKKKLQETIFRMIDENLKINAETRELIFQQDIEIKLKSEIIKSCNTTEERLLDLKKYLPSKF